MPRTPEDVINRLKTDVSLVRLVEDTGTKFTRQGKDYLGHCPFHDDKTPSLVVTPANNLWHCLGACNMGGSTIDWVMKSQGVSFKHAVEILKQDPSSLAANPVKTVPKLDNPISEDVDNQAVMQQVIRYYHTTLLASAEAQEYLAKRGLDDKALIDTFKLGYANRTLGLRLPQKNRKAGEHIRKQLQNIGLYRTTGREGQTFIMGLIDSNKLKKQAGRSAGTTHHNPDTNTMAPTSRDERPALAVPTRPQNGTNAGGSNLSQPLPTRATLKTSPKTSECTLRV